MISRQWGLVFIHDASRDFQIYEVLRKELLAARKKRMIAFKPSFFEQMMIQTMTTQETSGIGFCAYCDELTEESNCSGSLESSCRLMGPSRSLYIANLLIESCPGSPFSTRSSDPTAISLQVVRPSRRLASPTLSRSRSVSPTTSEIKSSHYGRGSIALSRKAKGIPGRSHRVGDLGQNRESFCVAYGTLL